MKLKNRNNAPVGGYWFVYEIEKDGTKYPVRVDGTNGGIDGLIAAVEKDMRAQNYPVPEDLAWIVEDQICQRQPSGICWKEARLGDKVAYLAQMAAATIDYVSVKTTGKNPGLAQKAASCPSCAKRKKFLNSLG